MGYSINRLHNENTIQTPYDDKLYHYNGYDWYRSKSKLHKVYNKKIDEIDLFKYDVDDYVATYRKIGNTLLYSENYLEKRKTTYYTSTSSKESSNYWVINNLIINEKNTLPLPVTYQNAPKFESINDTGVSGKVEHSISQIVDYKLGKTMIFSCLVKSLEELNTHNIALSIFNDCYNIGVSAKFYIPSNNESMVTPEPKILSKNFDTKSNNYNILASKIERISANIEKITNEDNTYYRCYITCKMPFSYQYRCQINLLNNNNEYKYDGSSAYEKYSIYISGLQLEQVNDDDVLIPDNYIRTLYKASYMNMFSGLFKIKGSKYTREYKTLDNQIHYFDSLVESRILDGNQYQYIIKEYTPKLYNINKDDIALLPTIISFTDNEDKNSAVMLGGNNINKADNGSIFFDSKNKEYKIKVNDKYNKISSKTPSNKSMIHSMIYNQGYFETWSEQGEFDHNIGYNTGGGFNFFKKNKLGY